MICITISQRFGSSLTCSSPAVRCGQLGWHQEFRLFSTVPSWLQEATGIPSSLRTRQVCTETLTANGSLKASQLLSSSLHSRSSLIPLRSLLLCSFIWYYSSLPTCSNSPWLLRNPPIRRTAPLSLVTSPAFAAHQLCSLHSRPLLQSHDFPSKTHLLPLNPTAPRSSSLHTQY